MTTLSIVLLSLLVIAVFLIIWIISTYNHFIHLSNMLKEAWSGIDVQLKRRFDLIPNLLETVKGYTKHEKDVFENVTKARAQSLQATNVQDKSIAEGQLTQALKTLFAVAENYPELKANENFLKLQQELSTIEGDLQLSRRYYNGTVRNYMIALTRLPSNIIAHIAHFEPAAYFEVETKEERSNPQINF